MATKYDFITVAASFFKFQEEIVASNFAKYAVMKHDMEITLFL